MSITIPVPTNFCDWLWLVMGALFGRAFGKKLDQSIQADPWFQRRHRIWKAIIKRLLDFTHHFWIGGLLMCYPPCQEAYWFGAGLFLDDLPDIPVRLKKILKGYREWWAG